MTPTDLHELRLCFSHLDRHVGDSYHEEIVAFHFLLDIWITTRDVLHAIMTEVAEYKKVGSNHEPDSNIDE